MISAAHCLTAFGLVALATVCLGTPNLLQQASCPPSASADGGCWVEILHEVSYTGTTVPAGYPALLGGSFTRVRATHVSGWISCLESREPEMDLVTFPWQGCASVSGWQGAPSTPFSFELMHARAGTTNPVHVFQSQQWYLLPPECAVPVPSNGPIVCDHPSGWNVEAGDLVVPTWFEPTTGSQASDNGGTIVVNIEGWVEFVCDLPASEWLKTEFMPELDVAATGFNTGVKDEFLIQFSYHRKYFDVSPSSGAITTSTPNGFVHSSEIDTNDPCWDIHQVAVPWATLVSECARGEEGGASGFVTYTCKLEVDSREALSPIRSHALTREIHNEIPFIVKFPKQVSVSVVDLSAVAPPNVLAAIIRQEVTVNVEDVTNVDAKIRLFTSTQFPFRLNVGSHVLNSLPNAAIALDSFNNAIDCADPQAADEPNAGENAALACSQEWLLDLQVDASVVCQLDGSYQVQFAAECYPDFEAQTDCPLVEDDQGQIVNEFVVDFVIDSEDFCPKVVENVQVSATLDVYKDLAHSVSASNFIQGQTAYFVVEASSPQVTVVEVSVDDVDVTVTGGPNAGSFAFYVDGVANVANPAGLSLTVQNSGVNGNDNQAWFQFVVADDPFEAPLDGSADFNVDVVCNVVFKDAALNLLSYQHRVRLQQDGSSSQLFAVTTQAGVSNSDSTSDATSGAMAQGRSLSVTTAVGAAVAAAGVTIAV